MKKIAILGNGGFAKYLADVIKMIGELDVVGFIGKKNEQCALFTDDDMDEIKRSGVRKIAIGIGNLSNNWLDSVITRYIDAEFEFPVIVHPSATVSREAKLGRGVLVMEQAVVKSQSTIEEFCLLNSLSVTSHGCNIGRQTHLSLGAKIGGDCIVGENTLLGINSTVIQGVKIGDNTIVGAGTVVLKNVAPNSVIVGNPGRVIKKR